MTDHQQPPPRRTVRPGGSIESVQSFWARLSVFLWEPTTATKLIEERDIALRADERARVIEALRRLRAMKPPDARDVDYALARIQERGLGPLIAELTREETE